MTFLHHPTGGWPILASFARVGLRGITSALLQRDSSSSSQASFSPASGSPPSPQTTHLVPCILRWTDHRNKLSPLRNSNALASLRPLHSRTTSASTQVALAWLRYRPVPVIPILGARKLTQLQDNLASLDLQLSPRPSKDPRRRQPNRPRLPVQHVYQRPRPRHCPRRPPRPNPGLGPPLPNPL